MKYAKMEVNQQIKKLTAEHLRTLIEDAVKMDNLVNSKNLRLSYVASVR
jgi:hypothetical protein